MTARRELYKPILFYTFAGLLVVFAVLPFLWMISTSLKSKGALMTVPIEWIPHPVSFEGYQKVFTRFPFSKAIFNSLYVSVMTTVILLLSSAMAAYVFAKVPFKGREALFAVFLATMMIPGQVTTIPIFLVLKKIHLINTFTGLLMPSIFNAFSVFMLRQHMRTIHDAFLEAAHIDGASRARIFAGIVLPLSAPILATLGLITFMGAWNDYFWPLVVLSDKAKMTLPLALSQLNGQYASDYNIMMAGSLISIVPIVVLYLSMQRFLGTGLQLGGVK